MFYITWLVYALVNILIIYDRMWRKNLYTNKIHLNNWYCDILWYCEELKKGNDYNQYTTKCIILVWRVAFG